MRRMTNTIHSQALPPCFNDTLVENRVHTFHCRLTPLIPPHAFLCRVFVLHVSVLSRCVNCALPFDMCVVLLATFSLPPLFLCSWKYFVRHLLSPFPLQLCITFSTHNADTKIPRCAPIRIANHCSRLEALLLPHPKGKGNVEKMLPSHFGVVADSLSEGSSISFVSSKSTTHALSAVLLYLYL